MKELKKKGLVRELKYTASKAGGPGGQHVNKTSSAVELRFNISTSGYLSEPEKELLKQKLKNRISQEGELILHASGSRSQGMNKREITDRFFNLLIKSLQKKAPRKSTKPTAASKKKRVEEKKKLKMKKELRKRLL